MEEDRDHHRYVDHDIVLPQNIRDLEIEGAAICEPRFRHRFFLLCRAQLSG